MTVPLREAHPHSRRPLTFFPLVFALSLPFWIAGQISPVELLTGLPAGTLRLVTPTIAASILVYQEGGTQGVLALLGRALDFRRVPPLWYIPVILLMPSLAVLSYGVMRLMRVPLLHPQIPLLVGLALWPALMVAAMAEELGSDRYAGSLVLPTGEITLKVWRKHP
jgi:hypothetical protein